MKATTKGQGQPELTVIGSLHGDEPAGMKAIEKILQTDIEFLKPVKFIIANEEALEEEERYLKTDINRSFPGNPESNIHEERLAAELLEEIGDTKVLDIHTTHSYPEPFAVIKSTEDEVIELVNACNVENAVYFPTQSGNIQEFVTGVTIETGYQRTEKAAENAVDTIKNFLAYHGAIDQDYSTSEPRIFEYTETVEGDWTFKAENFQKVKKGEVYAEKDGESLVADHDFYPVLMSTNGYEGHLGYKAKKL
ncbi:MAG: succinylglutamate desuccinylase [Candidatus Nanohaloarchaea archaeon]|jgi:succinylglutamate desuccinylase